MGRTQSMTHDDFLAWHTRMGYSYTTGAEALGVDRSSYADYVSGIKRNTGKPMVYKRPLALACAALEAGLQPVGTTHVGNSWPPRITHLMGK